MMIATVTCENGHSWSTRINGTIESIKRYFLGTVFDTGTYLNEEMSKCVKCEVKEIN